MLNQPFFTIISDVIMQLNSSYLRSREDSDFLRNILLKTTINSKNFTISFFSIHTFTGCQNVDCSRRSLCDPMVTDEHISIISQYALLSGCTNISLRSSSSSTSIHFRSFPHRIQYSNQSNHLWVCQQSFSSEHNIRVFMSVL